MMQSTASVSQPLWTCNRVAGCHEGEEPAAISQVTGNLGVPDSQQSLFDCSISLALVHERVYCRRSAEVLTQQHALIKPS